MAKAKKSSASIAYEKITKQLIEKLEKGIVPWRKPWNIIGGQAPINLVTKNPYRGFNLMMLASSEYKSNVWATFNQWKGKGGFVRKDEKGTIITYWRRIDKKDQNGNLILDDKGNAKKFSFLKISYVYNAEQIEGIELEKYIPKLEKISEFEIIENAEKIYTDMKNKPILKHTGNSACYSPVSDIVKMPTKEQFHSNNEYYGTLFHELSHSTGHKKRLDRDLKNSFGTEKYSKEELIAEISTCFLTSSVGISQNFDNSASYIQSWLKKLSNDPKMIISASSKAVKATEYILNIEKKY